MELFAEPAVNELILTELKALGKFFGVVTPEEAEETLLQQPNDGTKKYALICEDVRFKCLQVWFMRGACDIACQAFTYEQVKKYVSIGSFLKSFDKHNLIFIDNVALFNQDHNYENKK